MKRRGKEYLPCRVSFLVLAGIGCGDTDKAVLLFNPVDAPAILNVLAGCLFKGIGDLAGAAGNRVGFIDIGNEPEIGSGKVDFQIIKKHMQIQIDRKSVV